MKIKTVYIDSFDDEHRAQSRKLIELSAYIDSHKYSIADDPINSDIILLCDAEFTNYFTKIRANKLLKTYTNKCFVLSNIDRPLTLHRGLYTSAEKSFFNFGRMRSCAYTAYFDPYKNPYISNHACNDVNEKKYLFSFIGRRSDKTRDEIFRMNFIRQDILMQDSSEIYNLYLKESRGLARQKVYYETLLNSKFSLCPRGWGASSIRLFESMQLGIAPIIISDEWILPSGPKWNEFSIIIKSRDLHNLERLVADKEDKYIEMGKMAKRTFDKFFSDSVYFNYVLQNCLEIKAKQFLPESFYYYLSNIPLLYSRVKNKLNYIINKL